MTTLYTSSLITPPANPAVNPIELLIPFISTITPDIKVLVAVFSSGTLLGNINPSKTYIENCNVGNTRVRIYLKNSLQQGQTVQITVNDNSN